MSAHYEDYRDARGVLSERGGVNRHAEEHDSFAWCAQSTLNRHRDKPPLDTMRLSGLLCKLLEEFLELIWAMAYQSVRRALRLSTRFVRVEQEALDVYVVLLAIWMWSRGKG